MAYATPALSDTHYVNINCATPISPYMNWGTAATNIQDAIDVSAAGDVVFVTNGVYATGGRVVIGATTNRVAITKAIVVQSVNGPTVTIIQGKWPMGNSAVRCVYAGTNATLVGFTLTNGATRLHGDEYEGSGGAVICATNARLNNCILLGNMAEQGGGAAYGTLSNCVISGNSIATYGYGGAAFYCTLINCTLSSNSAAPDGYGGGAAYSTLKDCKLFGNTAYAGGGAAYSTLNNCSLSGSSAHDGGGAYYGTLSNCTLSDNSAAYGGGSACGTLNNCALSGNSAAYGGGSYVDILNNCTLYGNYSRFKGGGAESGTLRNCTITGNTAADSYGGIDGGDVKNCIVYFNSAPIQPNGAGTTINYCCITPMPGGTGNITNAPCLLSPSHIAADSPCVGKGSTLYVSGADIDGETWRTGPSIGADEPYATLATGLLVVAIGRASKNVGPNFVTPLAALIQGRVTGSAWDFGDGSRLTNVVYASHAWATTGTYAVVLTAWNVEHVSGVACTALVSVVEQINYVNVSNSTPAYPYASWATAATNIQQAIGADATPGRLVLVADGVYEVGGAVVYGNMTNRIVVTNAVTVRSVNGPRMAIIKGKGPVTNGAIRCAYVGKDCMLAGFTLTNGATRTWYDESKERSGGGAWCEPGGVLSNCTLSGNSASSAGGGAYGGALINCILCGNSAGTGGGGAALSTLNNCRLTGNSALASGGGAASCTLYGCTLSDNSSVIAGGGVSVSTLNSCTLTRNNAPRGGGSGLGGTLNNCTLIGNSAQTGGGAYGAALNNCIVYYNEAPGSQNCLECTVNACCTTPAETGSITNEPRLVSLTHIAADSPCVGKGSALYVSGTDIDGDAWRSSPSIGADEPYTETATGELSVAIRAAYTKAVAGFNISLIAEIEGRVSLSIWDFGDGSRQTNSAWTSHAWATPGTYAVALTAWNADHSSGVACTTLVTVVEQPVCYVNVANNTPAFPYTSWRTAATNIQQAISADVTPGRLVLVTNGVYGAGGIVVSGAMTNRIALNNAVLVRSVNGPKVTIVKGVSPTGTVAVRCAYIGKDCVLAGFMLTNGATRASGDLATEQSGGGAWCDSGGVVSNCILAGNSARAYGGGSYGGLLKDCILTGNKAANGYGGGSYIGSLYNCTLIGNSSREGGGAHRGTLNKCTLTGNSATSSGGGSYWAELNNCILSGNSAPSGGGAYAGAYTLNNCLFIGNASTGHGGGVINSTVNNCTLIGNSAVGNGGGVSGSTVNNCILYNNTASSNSNFSTSTLNYCCTTPLAVGAGNTTNSPAFQDAAKGNYRLSAMSPCVNAGQNEAWMYEATDLDGKPRVRSGTVDMGAFEFVFAANLKGLLQGAYTTNTHEMVSLAGTNRPSRAPYASDARTVAAVPANTVDWALVEVQDTNGHSMASTSVILDPAGRVMDTAGGTNIAVEVLAGNYYLVLKHRNHLAAMSALPVAFTNTVVSYDFTTGPDKYFGGTNACVKLEPGVWGLIGGDADGDGKITPVDRIIVERQRGMTGYLQGDLNLDGNVDGGDE